MKNEKGFTLIEMMIVLLVISVLLIVTVPSIARNNSTVNDKGCEVYLKMVEAQVQSYEMDKGSLPTDVEALINGKYLKSDQATCPHGKVAKIDGNGGVTITDHES